MTSTIGVKKIQYPNGTDILTLDSSGTLAIGGNITSNITTTGTVNTPSINGGQIGGRRNIIINGAMQVAQRGTSSTSIHGSGYYTCDRFNVNFVNEDELRTTIAQDTTGPSGFSNSFKITSTTAESAVAADEELRVIYKVEAQDLQQLAFGTSDAKTITVSFYVKSTIAATYGFNLYQNDANKVNGQSYTINSANTWERKTLTFTGNTSDVINNDNGIGMQLNWFLMAGSDYTSGSNSGWETFATAKHAVGHNANAVVTTTNATWQITGVQLEVGSQATPFEHRSFGEELALCHRYFQVHNETTDSNALYTFAMMRWSTNTGFFSWTLKQDMRAEPTATILNNDGTSPSGNAGVVSGNNNTDDVTAGNFTLKQAHDGRATFTVGLDFNPSGAYAHALYFDASKKIYFDAEL